MAGGEEARGAGVVAPTFDPAALAAAIAEAADHPARCREMGEAGHRFISSRLVQRTILDRYAETLEAMGRGEIAARPTWDPFP